YLGLAPARVTVARQADEDRLVANVRMDVVAVSLDAVTVRARAPQRGAERPTPGSTERNLTPEAVARLPIDASDLNTLATLAPGVVAISETDSTSAAFSVAGQRATANNITLDGLSCRTGCSHSARYKGAGADRHCHRSPRPMRRASSGSE